MNTYSVKVGAYTRIVQGSLRNAERHAKAMMIANNVMYATIYRSVRVKGIQKYWNKTKQ